MSAPQGTIAALVERFAAPNPMENTSINKAAAYGRMMAEFGMPFDSIVAEPGGSVFPDPENEVSIVQLQTMGVNGEDAFMFLHGKFKDTPPDGGPVYDRYSNIAQGIQKIAGLSGTQAFRELYDDRNVGKPNVNTAAAILQVPAAAAAANAALDAIKAQSKL
jgi:hypothetical protein